MRGTVLGSMGRILFKSDLILWPLSIHPAATVVFLLDNRGTEIIIMPLLALDQVEC
jgi:hypothetical protein